MGSKADFRVVALDADDTLWHNDGLFVTTHAEFRALLTNYHDPEWIDQRLYETEKRNLSHYGYGVKSFTLSMIETAVELTEGRITGAEIQKLIDLGREMLQAPVELLEGVEDVVRALSGCYFLMLLTKGDLFDQESKLARSGLGEHFSAVEIVSEKDARTYTRVMDRHGVRLEQFLMVGDSLRSDVLPVLEVGGAAVHIPYRTTWVHEQVSEEALHGKKFVRLRSLGDLPNWLEQGV
jgi:putative hydrolase of the HAD superfamily